MRAAQSGQSHADSAESGQHHESAVETVCRILLSHVGGLAGLDRIAQEHYQRLASIPGKEREAERFLHEYTRLRERVEQKRASRQS